MATLKEFLESMGGLHDSVVTQLIWRPEEKLLRLEIQDLCSNFEGLPEYPGVVPGAIELRNVGQVQFDIDTSEGRLNVHDFSVESVEDGYRSSVSFWPTGRITALHSDASFPTVRLRDGA
jgi:hypothetical protein